jgi:hypothetical protein
MTRIDTLNSTLNRFQKFYEGWRALQENKEDHSYLGYPFNTNELQSRPSKYTNFENTKLLFRNQMPVYERGGIPSQQSIWVYDFIGKCFMEETHVELATYIYHIEKNLTYQHMDGRVIEIPHIRQFVQRLRPFNRIVNKLFRREFPSEWEPNA